MEKELYIEMELRADEFDPLHQELENDIGLLDHGILKIKQTKERRIRPQVPWLKQESRTK